MALLEATAITKSFAGVQALKSVSFELRSGDVHALLYTTIASVPGRYASG